MARPPVAACFAVLLAIGLIVRTSPSRAASQDEERFLTDRVGARSLELTDDTSDAFTFAVFGDRTGGPDEGIEVLRQAVRDTNLIAPDLVMTVGDLVQGYNTTAEWLVQAAEYSGAMKELDCPWFPVSGNHDLYWRGPGRPALEHEENYERYFGPLWYAFEHKGAWFLVLCADETNPDTGEKRFNDPAHQRMSPEQFAWLKETIARTSGAKHVFVFLHHPRWITERYGDGWEPVHKLLVDAGNVRAVFAGHIHHMRYDPQDGIEYFSLATVGGHQNGTVPAAGYLHQFSLVTVREDGIATVSLPVGEAQDPRAITGAVSESARRAINRRYLRVLDAPSFEIEAGGRARIEVELANPLDHPIRLSFRAPIDGDPRWRFSPGHAHRKLDPGETAVIPVTITRLPGPVDEAFAAPFLALDVEIHFDAFGVPLPARDVEIPIRPILSQPPTRDRVLALDGDGDFLTVAGFELPDGPFTVEAWIQANGIGDSHGIVAKTESSEFGLFLSDGKPSFFVHLNGSYAIAEAESVIEAGAWHHVAGQFDGAALRVFVDGRRVASREASGTRKTNQLPLVVGGDVTSSGGARQYFDGRIDEVRVTAAALYPTDGFAPSRPLDAAEQPATLWLDMDASVGPWVLDRGPSELHATRRGGAKVVDRP